LVLALGLVLVQSLGTGSPTPTWEDEGPGTEEEPGRREEPEVEEVEEEEGGFLRCERLV